MGQLKPPFRDKAPQKTIPLPTPFTPPPDCSSHWTYYEATPQPITTANPQQSPSAYLLLQNAASDFASCFPTGFNGGHSNTELIYEPASCPVGYSPNTTLTTHQGTVTAACCSDQFSYTTITHGTPGATYEGCMSTSSGSLTSVTVITKGEDKTPPPVNVTGSLIFWAQPITISFNVSMSSPSPSSVGSVQMTSIAIVSGLGSIGSAESKSPTTLSSMSAASLLSGVESSATAAMIVSPTTSAITSINTTPTLSDTPQGISTSTGSPANKANKSHSNHLLAGAKAGIAVSVLLLAALLAAAAFLFIRRRKQAENSQKFTMMPSLSQNSLAKEDDNENASQSSHSAITVFLNTPQQTGVPQPSRKSWKLPARFPSWKSRVGADQIATGSGMQEVPVSPVSPISSSSYRRSGARVDEHLDVKKDREIEPISPVSPVT